ncbi:MAG: FecR domain-containing protein [Burkholderiales bacterium]|nr:FecR domain-containing protein [Burkholderiales bacterium]
MVRQFRLQRLAPVALGIGALLASAGAIAQSAGEVEFSRGVGFAQTPGQLPRTLGKGMPLREGDRLTTSEGGLAVIKLEDGTRMTVRPNSELVIQQYQFKENASDNTMLMQLVRGGFRAVTGLISKSSPNAARVQTNTATIGIRGTDFDARICSSDCKTESSQISAAARPNTVQASAKVVSSQGVVNAVDGAGQRRRLVEGGSIYPGDMVETGSGTQAVLAFRDDTRITLGSTTQFRVDNFIFDDKNAGEGRFLVSLLRGSVRALTGLIAKANNRNVGFSTATATIGVRGSGADLVFNPATAGLTVFSWLGAWTVQGTNQTALQLLQAGQGLLITPTGIQAVTVPPVMEGRRPDTDPPIDPKLFGNNTGSEESEGLFVVVRDGHIELLTAKEKLQLGKGETGGVNNSGDTFRPTFEPKFFTFDRIPKPGDKDKGLVDIRKIIGGTCT